MRLEPLSLGALLDRALRLVFGQFRPFLAFVLIGYLPMLVLTAGLAVTGHEPTGGLEQALYFGLWLLSGVIARAFLQLHTADVVLGRSRPTLEVMQQACRKLPAVFGATVLTGLSIGCGMILLIVPGLALMFGLTLTSEVVLLEDLGPTESLGRSWRLVSQSWGRTIGLTLALTGVNCVATFCWEGLCAYVLPTFQANPLGFVGSLLLEPLSAVTFVLLYYDILVRKEGFGLESLAEDMA